MMPELHHARRPIRARSSGWAIRLARQISQTQVTPNQISCLSMLFALVGAGCIIFGSSALTLIVAAGCIQLRLLCNLLDGMVAIEGGKTSIFGALYNEFPDRISDSILLIALGYAAQWPECGWLCALLAMMTAYIRVFGGALGLPHEFGGWFAKQQRMAILTVGLLAGAAEKIYLSDNHALWITTLILTVGTFMTCVTRVMKITALLKQNQHDL